MVKRVTSRSIPRGRSHQMVKFATEDGVLTADGTTISLNFMALLNY